MGAVNGYFYYLQCLHAGVLKNFKPVKMHVHVLDNYMIVTLKNMI